MENVHFFQPLYLMYVHHFYLFFSEPFNLEKAGMHSMETLQKKVSFLQTENENLRYEVSNSRKPLF